jgi:hypothetical protein
MPTDVSEVRAASIIRATLIALMMEEAHTSETSVDMQLRTRQYIPEDSELNIKLIQESNSVKSKTCHKFYNGYYWKSEKPILIYL